MDPREVFGLDTASASRRPTSHRSRRDPPRSLQESVRQGQLFYVSNGLKADSEWVTWEVRAVLRSRPAKGLLVLLCALMILLVATSASASGQTRILVDGRELILPIPASIEQGRVMVPLRSIVEALGASAYWIQDTTTGAGEVWIDSFPRVFSAGPVRQAPGSRQFSQPDFLGAVGASATLMQYLAGEQADSLSGKGPVLVRFELLDVQTMARVPAPPDDLTQISPEGFMFAVRIYYVQPTEASIGPELLAFQRLYDAKNPGQWTLSLVKPEVQGSWYEDVTFVVSPKGPPSYQKTANSETVIYGASGWEVDVESRTLVHKVDMDRSPFVVHGSFGR